MLAVDIYSRTYFVTINFYRTCVSTNEDQGSPNEVTFMFLLTNSIQHLFPQINLFCCCQLHRTCVCTSKEYQWMNIWISMNNLKWFRKLDLLIISTLNIEKVIAKSWILISIENNDKNLFALGVGLGDPMVLIIDLTYRSLCYTKTILV